MKNFRNTEQNNVDSVFNNIVDKDVQSMLWPLNLMQFFSFSPKYCFKNNRIFPNNLISNLVSIIGAIVFISLFSFRSYMLFIYKDYLEFTQFMTVSAFIDCAYYSIGYSLNFIIGIIQTKNNVKFVLLFQRVHRQLNNETSFSNYIIGNWIIVVYALTEHCVAVSYFNIKLNLPWFYLFVNYLLLVFDINVVYAIRVIKLLENKLELWNMQVLNCLEVEDTRHFCERMFQAYVDILECYNLHKVCFQTYILYYIIEVLIHSLIYIEVIIESIQIGARYKDLQGPIIGLYSILCWLAKGLVWQAMYMQHCETFYLAMRSVRDSCAVILMSGCSQDERRLCKNVLRLTRASFSKMSVCGLCDADAALQLSLMGLLANYIVVLLQFALL